MLFPEELWPEGFRYDRELLAADDELALINEIEALPLKEFDFHGYKGKRRVMSFGWRYDHTAASLEPAAPLPEFLFGVREAAAAFAGVAPESFVHVLVTEYMAGTTIGWHRDKYVFGDVVGVSLASPCVFRFRRKDGNRWERCSLDIEPRSFYLLRGPARTDWEHSIRPVNELRYSITFRTLRHPE
jgi:alkylated DNA repair dioxygenase AlkB